MKFVIWQLVCLFCYSRISYSQSIGPDEFVKLNKSSLTQIDSTMTTKGFSKMAGPSNDTAQTTVYFYQAVEEGVKVQRILIVGWNIRSKDVEVEYSLWQEKEATSWIDLLLKAGFARQVDKAADAFPKTFKVFKKNGNLFFCRDEIDNNTGRTRYIFNISKDFKGNRL